jgi:hypothetical protein
MKFFDILSDILTKKSGGNLYSDPEFHSNMSNFMVCRYLSMQSSLVPFAELLNQLQLSLDSNQFYKLAYNIVPKQKNGYIRYYASKEKKKGK